MKTFVVRTLGCKANAFDSQMIEAELKRRGWRPFRADDSGSADLCVINSCTVTDEADRQTRKLAARLQREHPGARVVVTGCAAEVAGEELLEAPGVAYVIGNRDKPKLVHLILERLRQLEQSSEPGRREVLGTAQSYSEMASRHPMDRDWPSVADFSDPPTAEDSEPAELAEESRRTRAFLKIQEGCNAFCTYCVIPYGRGPARSLPPAEVVAQAKQLQDRGFRELVITGTNIGAYGVDVPEFGGFESLLERVCKETSIERIRVGSLNPTELSGRFLDLMRSEPRICRHVHVSLQSPDPRILKRMKRSYGAREIRQALEGLHSLSARPSEAVFIGMDVITGFPGETPEIFEDSKALLRELPWTRLHVFPYSEREGTPATRLDGAVPRGERGERSRQLNELSLARLSDFAGQVVAGCLRDGEPVRDILLERGGKGGVPLSGYSANYLRVSIEQSLPGAAPLGPNQLVDAVPHRFEADARSGEVVFVARAPRPESVRR